MSECEHSADIKIKRGEGDAITSYCPICRKTWQTMRNVRPINVNLPAPKQDKPPARHSGGVKGVCWQSGRDGKSGSWRATACVGGVRVNLGRFALKANAIAARKDWEIANL